MKQSNKKTIVCVLLCVLFSVISAFALVGCKKTEEPKKTKLDSPVIASKTYTGSNQTATVAENEAYEVTVNAGGTNVGEYDVVLTLTDKKKYEWATPDADDKTKVTLKFAITKAGNEITVLTLADWTYDEQANEPTATAKFGTPEFTYATSENGEYTATVPSAVGKYWVKATVAGTDNYTEATKTAQFEIKKAASAVTTAPAARTELVYNRNAQELVTAGYADGGKLNYKLGEDGTWSETIPTATDAGDYKVYYKVVGDGSHSDTAETEISVTIAQATNEITGMVLADWTYGETANEPTATAKFGTATFTYATSENGTYSETVPIDAGDYWVKATVAETKNYAGATQTLKFTIAKAHSAITSNPAANQLTYNGEAQALVTAGESADGTLQYKLGADGEWSENIPIATNAGEYVVYFRLKGDKNHIDIESNLSVVNVTIAKAAATVTAPTAKTELVYNGNAQALASAGSVSDATLEYKLGDGEWGADVPAATNAGEYTVYYRVTVDNNHTGATDGSFKVAIAKAANEVTFSLDGEEIHCGDAVPTEFNATSVAGAITYAYSIDNVNFYPIDGLGEDFKFEAGKTYYVKATAAESENYLSANKVAQITATHNHTSETTDENGLTVLTCACGHKQVNGELNAAKTVNFAATVTEGAVSATAGELDISAVYGENLSATITVDGQEYANLGIVNGKITLKDVIPVTVYGQKAVGVKFTTGETDYNFTVNTLFVTEEVKDLTTLRNISAIEKLINGGGYYLFTTDVKLTGDDRFFRRNGNVDLDYTIGAANGVNGSTVNRPFVGTIDGNGHALDGLYLTAYNFGGKTGFINDLGKDGSLKNLAFTNVSLGGQCDIVSGGSGLIENVYVKYKTFGADNYDAFNADHFNQAQLTTFGSIFTTSSFIMKNIIVDFTAVSNKIAGVTISNAKQVLLGNYSKASLTNVVVLGVPKVHSEHIITGATAYVYYDDKTDNGVALPSSGWDAEFWSSANGGIPTFKGMTAYDKSSAFTKSATQIEAGATAEFAVSDYCLLYLGEDAKGIASLENGVVTVAEDATVGATFTVYSKNIFDTENVTELTVTVAMAAQKEVLETTVDIDLNVSVAEEKLVVGGTDVTVDLSGVFGGDCETPVVTLGGTQLGGASITAGKLTFNSSAVPASIYGTKTLVIRAETENTAYEITMPNVLVVTKMLSTKDDITNIAGVETLLGGGGYFKMKNDIQYNGVFAELIGKTSPFIGTIDGNRYRLSGLMMNGWDNNGASAMIVSLGKEGVLKNIGLTWLQLSAKGAVVGTLNGTVENVYVMLSTFTASSGNNQITVFGNINVENNNGTVKNVLIDFTRAADAMKQQTGWNTRQRVVGKLDGTVTNVVATGIANNFNNNVTDNTNVYARFEDGTDNGVNFPISGWDTNCWAVDASAKTVTWKNK